MVDRKRVPAHLHSRYGIVAWNRPLLILTAIAMAAISMFVFASIGNRAVNATDVRLITWKATSNTTVRINFSVNRPDDQPLVCTVRAQDHDRFDVGFAIARITHSNNHQNFTVNLVARGEIFTVPTPVCDLPGSASLIGSHFRPGLLPPAQSGNLAAPWQDLATPLN